MPRILITGGCGFIGRNLVETLHRKENFEIRVLDNESVGTRSVLDGFDVDFVAGDVADAATVSHALRDVDSVVHLAAHTSVIESVESPERGFLSNAVGTFNLLCCMREAGVRRIVNASTGGAILGSINPPAHEGMPPMPLSPYGASKLAAEGYCSAFGESYGLLPISLRFSNVYGPHSGQKKSVVSSYIRAIMQTRSVVIFGDGSQSRDFVFVDDICNAIVSAITSQQTGVFQLGSGVPTSIVDLVSQLKRIAGSSLEVVYQPARKGEVPHTWCDISKARNHLGYEPATPLECGLRKTWDWFLNQSHV